MSSQLNLKNKKTLNMSNTNDLEPKKGDRIEKPIEPDVKKGLKLYQAIGMVRRFCYSEER
jgi:hypothetical protein